MHCQEIYIFSSKIGTKIKRKLMFVEGMKLAKHINVLFGSKRSDIGELFLELLLAAKLV